MKATNHISRDFPDLILPRASDMISGLLYVPLTAKAGQDFIVFLRKGQAKEVKWAGKPYKDVASGEAASLEPRKSFKTWSEIVTGRSRAWTDDQMESAGVLALIYGKFIQVWREKQSAMASNQLTAILLSNTSHAVRTPLSQIINTLELALSGDIDPDTRNMLENSHQASRALLFHVHDLLDLTRIETGNETAFNDPFDLRQTIQDAVRLYQTESQRRNIEFRVNLDSSLPQFVIGDSRKIKTVISNLVANSVKFTENGWIEVYCGVQQNESAEGALVKPGYVPLEFVIADTGVGIPNDKLQAMFVTLEGVDELKAAEPTGLGLGLAVVARIVEQLAGQLRAESEMGVGSRFFFTLQMLEHDGRQLSRTNSLNSSLAPRGRTGSSGSGSVVSLTKSDGRSEIDSFVQDFGNSHMLGPVSKDDSRLRDAETRMNRPGTFPVTDSSYPVRPSKVDADEQDPSPKSTSVSGHVAALPSPGRPGPSRRITAASEESRHERSPTTPLSSTFASRHAQTHPLHARAHSAGHELAAEPPTPVKQGSGSSAAPVPTRSKRGPKGEQRLRVMVVEDDMINSQILQKRLKMDKHSVLVASNGQEAVDALRKDWDVDAVLMDIQ
jgi:signal transduction histidine kinase